MPRSRTRRWASSCARCRRGSTRSWASAARTSRAGTARAFLKDAPILILDEATSHLDAVNEQAVRESLALLAKARTTLVIAHRLSTVRDADLGDHESLLARGSLYTRLVARQI